MSVMSSGILKVLGMIAAATGSALWAMPRLTAEAGHPACAAGPMHGRPKRRKHRRKPRKS